MEKYIEIDKDRCSSHTGEEECSSQTGPDREGHRVLGKHMHWRGGVIVPGILINKTPHLNDVIYTPSQIQLPSTLDIGYARSCSLTTLQHVTHFVTSFVIMHVFCVGAVIAEYSSKCA